MSNTEKIKIDIVSDVACPWCYVGKRRLESAIAEWNGVPVEIEWHPFQLDPTIPAEGMSRKNYLINKFGSIERIQPMIDNLEAVGKELGIAFDFGKDSTSINTLPLHQLLHVAGEEGFKDALKERFLKAYFEENLRLNDIEVLASIMSAYGWSREKVEQTIADQDIADKVQSQIAYYQQRGVSGVPFFVINDTYGISGAQPKEAFLNAFASAVPQAHIEEGVSCDPETGVC
ncbi:MAG: putative DsbA family dithiol-disulfide isomerase [Saprospiraceae bacterium]|jgi:predicted DsbA family dithiol-disulfide isomerase